MTEPFLRLFLILEPTDLISGWVYNLLEVDYLSQSNGTSSTGISGRESLNLSDERLNLSPHFSLQIMILCLGISKSHSSVTYKFHVLNLSSFQESPLNLTKTHLVRQYFPI